jgi:hypothetical protein
MSSDLGFFEPQLAQEDTRNEGDIEIEEIYTSEIFLTGKSKAISDFPSIVINQTGSSDNNKELHLLLHTTSLKRVKKLPLLKGRFAK